MMFLSEIHEIMGIGRTAAPEAEVFAHGDPAAVEPLHEHFLHEVLRPFAGDALVEGQHVDPLHAAVENALHLVEKR